MFLLAIGLALVVDQVTKYFVRSNLDPGQSLSVEGPLRITYAYNSGAASGIFGGLNPVMALVAVLAIVALVNFCRRRPLSQSLVPMAVGLQIGGGVGNLADRLLLGHVVDFVDLGNWAILNLADLSIFAGFILMLWALKSSRGPNRLMERIG